jgi:AAA domain/3'-5' exonuclease/Primase C terminal 2 (PriCT-2)/Bifunctional DNA primase/polymerase, N-terminal
MVAWRGGRMAARGARAAIRDAGYWLSRRVRSDRAPDYIHTQRPSRIRVRRRTQCCNRLRAPRRAKSRRPIRAADGPGALAVARLRGQICAYSITSFGAGEQRYRLVRVRSASKAPLPHDWQHGDRPELLLDIRPNALNTGLLLGGFRCIDCDIDDQQLITEIMEVARLHLPAGALIRRRTNSPRVAMLYRAADGQPCKRAVNGPRGKIEILGLGQQVVVHGLHPSGAVITWDNGRGPDTVHCDHLPAVSEDQVSAFLEACAPLLGATTPSGASAHRASGPRIAPPPGFEIVPDHIKALGGGSGELGAGIAPRDWFGLLAPEEQSELVRACLDSLDNRTTDPRERWLRVIFAVAHAEELGCLDAHLLALEWSRRGAKWTDEAAFETAWGSYKSKQRGATVGTLIGMAKDAGLDVSPWRDVALARFRGATGAALTQATVPPAPSSTSLDPYTFLTIDPDDVPPHRQWSVGTKLIEGELTVIAAKGGWGKTAHSIGIACSAASGRDLLNLKIYGDAKSVLCINSEDDTDEVRRRFIAAARHHKLSKADLARIKVRGVDTPGHQTLTTGDESAPRVNEEGFTALDEIMTRASAKILVLDPLGPFCPAGLNQNGVMSQVMLRLKRLARKHRCAILIVHHTRKDGDLTNVDAIGGASAIVNQARVAIMVARMTEEEAKKFKGILSSELWRYFRIVDAKTNLAPPTSNAQWYQLVSYELPNKAPPTYANGDGVQVVDKVDPAQINASPVGSGVDDVAKRAILKVAHSADPPFSPSARGGSDRYIVPQVLDAVRQATRLDWPERDMTKHITSLVQEMMSAGWLYVKEVKVAGNKRKGVLVNYPSTPWSGDLTDTVLNQGITDALAAEQPRKTEQPPQFVKSNSKTIEAGRDEGIDARRPRGASNVPKGCGDLTRRVFDATPTASVAAPLAPAELPLVPRDAGVVPELPPMPVADMTPPYRRSHPDKPSEETPTTILAAARSAGVKFTERASDGELVVEGLDRLTPDDRQKLQTSWDDVRNELLPAETSTASLELLNKLGVELVYIDTEKRAAAEVQRICGSPRTLGLDLETAPQPQFLPVAWPIAITKDGRRSKKQMTRDTSAALDPFRAEIRLLQVAAEIEGRMVALVLDLRRVPLGSPALAPLWGCRLVGHNISFDAKMLAANGVQIADKNLFDTILMAGLVLRGVDDVRRQGSRRPSLADAVKERLGVGLPKTSQLSPWWHDQLTREQIAYAALDAVFALKLAVALMPPVKELRRGPDGKALLGRLCAAVGPVVRMELAGIAVDRTALAKQADAWDRELAALREKIAEFGIKNPSSALQVAAWLSHELEGLDATNSTNWASNWPRTPGGSLSTTNQTLGTGWRPTAWRRSTRAVLGP